MTEEPVSPNTLPPATPQQPAPESSDLAGAVNGGTLENTPTPVTPAPAPALTPTATPAPATAAPTPVAEPTVSSYAQTVTQRPLDDTLEVQNEGVTHYPKQASVNAASLKAVGFSRRKALLVSVIITLLSMLILTGALFAFARLGQSNKGDNSPVAGVPTQQLDLGQSNQSQLDLTNRTVALVVNGNVAVKGNIQIDTGGHTIKIQAAGIATDQLVTLPNASGTICLSSNNCGYLTPSDLAAVNDKFGQITFPTIPASVSSLNTQTGDIVLQGTTNQVTLTANGKTITLATPQDLNTTAAVQFGDITTDTLTGTTITTTSLVATSLTATTASIGTIQQLAAGTDITINSGSDEIVFVVGGTTFKFPGGGPATQVVCTTGVTCASGGGQAVLLAPTSVQVDNTADPSIFINDTGGGNLLQLQTSGVDKLVVANNGDVTISGNLKVGSLGASSQSLSLIGSSASSFVVGSGLNTTTLSFASPSGANTLTFPAATGTVCISSVACSPTGTAGGDLTGTYPNPTIAKLQGATVTISGPASGEFLMYNGSNWLNQGLSGDVTVNGSGVAAIQPNAVTLGTDTTGNYVATIGTLTGLSTSGNTGEGSTPTLSVLYGSSANTAVQGNVTLTCPSGTGNLSGGGTSITLGTGGSCAALDTVSTPTFTSATLQGSNALTLGVTGSATGAILFKGATAASGTISLVGPANPTNNTITLPNETGTICTTGSVCSGYAAVSGSGTYVQLAPGSAQIDASTNSSVFINKTGASGNILQVQKSGSDVLLVSNSGAITASNNININGNTVLGDASSDTLTINSLAVSIPNNLNFNSNTLYVDAGNNSVGIGDGTPTEGSRLVVSGNAKNTTNGTVSYLGGNLNSSTSDFTNVLRVEANVAPGSASSQNYTGALLQATTNSSNISSASIMGANAQAYVFGSANVTAATGLQAYAQNDGSGTVATLRGINITSNLNSGGGAVTNNYGLYVNSQTAGTNDYGIWIQGADTYALYVNSGATRLGGNLTVTGGNTSLTGQTTGDALTVNNSTSTGNILVLQDNGSAVLTVADGGAVTATNTVTIQGSNALTLGIANSVTGAILFKDSTSSFTGTLVVGGLSQDRTFTLPSQGGTICTDSGNCAGAGTTLQSAYNNSGGGITPEITLNNGGNTGGVDVQNSYSSPVVGSLFAVRDGASSGLGTALFDISNTGATTIQSSSNSAFLIQSNDSALSTLFKVDASGNSANLVTNPSFETAVSGWTTRGSASGLAQSGAKYLYGTKSLVFSTAATSDAVSYTVPSTLSPSTQYNLSMYVQRLSGSSTNMQLCYSYDGNAANDSCTNSQFVGSAGWTRLSTLITTGSGGTAPTSGNTVTLKQANAVSISYYIDGVLLEASTTSQPSPYREATFSINGAVNTAINIKPTYDSINALQVLTSDGSTNVFNVDTTNQRVTVGNGNLNPASSSARFQVNASTSSGQVVLFNQGSSGNTTPGYSVADILALTNSGTGSSLTVANFGQGYYNDTSGAKTFASLTPNFVPSSSSTASYTGLSVAPVVNFQAAGAGSFTAVSINPTYTAAPSGTNTSLKVNTSLSTAIGIIIQGAASQSADMIQYQDSGGTKLLGMTPVTGGTAFTDSSNQQLFKFDTTNNILKVGDSTGTDTATTILQVDAASAAPTTGLSSRNGGLYYNSTLGKLQFIEGNAVKTFCNTSDLGCGNEGSVTLQSAYNNSSSPAAITTTAGAKTITFAAGATFDSATLFTIQNAAGANLFVVDSLNNNGAIKIGGGDVSADGSPVLLVFDHKSTSGDPTGIEGAMYYNASSKLFRCYSNGYWQPCSSLEIERRFELTDEFISGGANSNQIGALGWSFVNGTTTAATIGYNSSPGMSPSADHPGVLYNTEPAAASGYNINVLKLGTATGSSAGWVIQPGNVVKTTVATDNTSTNFGMRVGIHSQGTGNTNAPNVGVWWEAVPGTNANWRYCYGTGSAATCAASSTAIAANTWVRLEIYVTSTTAITFVINGTAYSVTGITLDTTTATYPSMACYTAENTARTCSMDYYQVRGLASALR